VTANRDAFLTDDAILPFVSVEVLIPVADNVVIVTQIEFTDFSDLKDSPLLNDDTNTTATLGVAYQF
jgi:outer membrane scaffolding protein for murein synthesis (MipA/OmpV family)